MRQKLTRFFASLDGGSSLPVQSSAFSLPYSSTGGNPPNMGICVACFERDIAGALGLHRASVVQYLRPEIMGFVLGSVIAALLFREWKARGGSAPIVRFILGMLAMIGALVFLGCPWRALLRLAGGDMNAIVGLIGLAVGIAGGVWFLKNGYTLGASAYTTRHCRLDHAFHHGVPAHFGYLAAAILRRRGPSFPVNRGPDPWPRLSLYPLLLACSLAFWPNAPVSAPWGPSVMSSSWAIRTSSAVSDPLSWSPSS